MSLRARFAAASLMASSAPAQLDVNFDFLFCAGVARIRETAGSAAVIFRVRLQGTPIAFTTRSGHLANATRMCHSECANILASFVR